MWATGHSVPKASTIPASLIGATNRRHQQRRAGVSPAGSGGIPAARVFCGQGCPQNRQPGWLPYDHTADRRRLLSRTDRFRPTLGAAMIHPTAIVHPKAQLDPTGSVGPYALIDEHVIVGANCRIGPHAHLTGHTTIGANNSFHTGCVIGDAPQDLKYKGEPTRLRIGEGNVFREHVTLHRSNVEGEAIGIGSHNIVM